MLFEKFSNPDGSPPGFFLKAGMGMAAGASGAFVGTPAEVRKERNKRLNLISGKVKISTWTFKKTQSA